MRIGGAALNQTPLDWRNNTQNIIEALDRAKKEKIELLCLPELCITGYSCEDMFLHPWVCERAMKELFEIIPQTLGVGVAIGLPIRIANRVYNTLAFVQNGELKGFYAKQHLPYDGIHYEPRWFTPWLPKQMTEVVLNGRSYPFGHFTTQFKGHSLAFEICEDAWVVDRPACHLESSVDIILNTSASHFAFNKVKRRQEIIRASSAQFDCIYLYTNQLGNEAGTIIYDGDVIIAQKGKLLATTKRFSFQNVSIHSIEVDNHRPELSETNLYDQQAEKNDEFPNAAGLALFDYLRKSKSKGFVLSLSGGADSSTMVILIAEMVKRGIEELGFALFVSKIGLEAANEKELMAQLLTTAYQGTINSSEETFLSAKELSATVGAAFHQWEIDEEVTGYSSKVEKVIGRKLDWERDDIALQNIQARARSPIIWMLANLKNALLLATSNRSEGALGYATMDGDTSGSISPIAGVDKAFIREWLKYAETELGYSALKRVNAMAPTAELRPLEKTQTDEQDLMPYEVLQKIEALFVKERLSPDEIIEQLKSEFPEVQLRIWIDKFFQLWKRNQWKRERLAPSFHFDDYNLNPRSWFRYPILSGD